MNQNKNISKPCKNGCGVDIQWDSNQNFFIEVANGTRHKCPNWKHQTKNTTEVAEIKQIIHPKYIDTSEILIADIHRMVKRVYDMVTSLLDKDHST